MSDMGKNKPSTLRKGLLVNDSEAASIMTLLFHDRGAVGDGASTGFPYILFTMIISFRHLSC